MTFLMNCGEVETENNGISISLTAALGAKNTTPSTLFINFIDNLLGISEFIAENSYNFAEVGIEFRLEGESTAGYLDFEQFLNDPENIRVKELFTKYCRYECEEPTIEEDEIWYYFIVENIKAEMSDEDHLEFCKIFKERLKANE